MPRITLFDAEGNRKYLTPDEREKFYDATGAVTKDQRMFALMLYATGCRLSEALNIKIKDIDSGISTIDISNKTVVFEILRHRQKGIFREIPLPVSILDELQKSIKKPILYYLMQEKNQQQ